MELLDAIIAFALTLAALATVVTIFLEIFVRVVGLKAQRQVELFTRLFDDVVAPQLPAAARGWDVVRAILQSRASDKQMAASPEAQRFFGTAAGAIYDDVSLEHVLRRLLETTAGKALAQEAEETLKARLGLIARKYEEYCSALGADFKRNALRWSIWIGIALAFAMNADGVRLFATYLEDPALRQQAIERLAEPTAQTAAPEPGTEVPAGVQAAQRQLALIDALALPIGPGYFPYCHLPWLAVSESADPLCRPATPLTFGAWLAAWLLWVAKVLVTGILIGLGAPFWYDVARRLAAVRSAFGGKGTAEAAHRGADASGSAASRRALIDQIVADAKAEARLPPPAPAAAP